MTDYTVTIQESSFDVTVTGDTTTIVKQVIGGPHGHAVSDLWQSGATTGQVPTWSGTAWAPATPSGGGGGGVTDGDKGDIVVSGGGAVWSIDYTAVNATIAPTWANVTSKPTISGTNTGDQTSIVGITGTLAEFNAALTGDNFATGGGTATGTNTGDQTSIVGITGTRAQFNTALTGDNFAFDGDAPASHTHAAADVAAPGSTTQFIFNSGGVLTGAANVEYENNQLRLESIASPATPASGGVSLIGVASAGRTVPAFIEQAALARELQTSLAGTNPAIWKAGHNVTALNVIGSSNPSSTGTAAVAAFAGTSVYTNTPKLEWLQSTPTTSNTASFRGANAMCTVGGPSAGLGGLIMEIIWGPATGVSTATHRALCGLITSVVAVSDVEPSSLVSCAIMGWDAADTNVQIMHNDGSGTCTKVDLGASFPAPTADRTSLYKVQMYSPSGTTQRVDWRVLDLVSGAVATGSITTNLPATSTLMRPGAWVSVGGTSSVVGIAMTSMYLDTLV